MQGLASFNSSPEICASPTKYWTDVAIQIPNKTTKGAGPAGCTGNRH